MKISNSIIVLIAIVSIKSQQINYLNNSSDIIPLINAKPSDLTYPANVLFSNPTSITRMAEKYITFVAFYCYMGNPKEYVLIIGINTFGKIYFGALEFRVENGRVILDKLSPLGNDLEYFKREYHIPNIPENFRDHYPDYDDDFKELYRASVN